MSAAAKPAPLPPLVAAKLEKRSTPECCVWAPAQWAEWGARQRQIDQANEAEIQRKYPELRPENRAAVLERMRADEPARAAAARGWILLPVKKTKRSR